MDARRRADNLPVVLKRVPRFDNRCREAEVMRILSEPSVANDHKNHCIRLLDQLDVPSRNATLLVLPQLTPLSLIKFERVGETVDLLRQLLEVRPPRHMIRGVLTPS